jgi:hypothetical protein
MWNRYSVRWRSRRPELEYRFERALTFDPTVGSPSNFYWSFQMLFSGVDVELLLDAAEVSSVQTSVPVRKGQTFDSTIVSPLKF